VTTKFMTIKTPTRRNALVYVRSRTIADAPAIQLQALRHLVVQHDWQVAGEFLDLPGGGAKHRDALLTEIRRGAHSCGVLVCPSLSQLTTSVREAVQILNELAARGWDLVTSDGLDTSTSVSKNELVTMFAALAALDRTGVAERARAALDQGRREGRKLGRKKITIPFETVRALLDAGRSWREIARSTGISVGTLHRAMKRQPAVFDASSFGFLEAA
jgi:DNA invertase Pin-like site-specific DNA recombinase